MLRGGNLKVIIKKKKKKGFHLNQKTYLEHSQKKLTGKDSYIFT